MLVATGNRLDLTDDPLMVQRRMLVHRRQHLDRARQQLAATPSTPRFLLTSAGHRYRCRPGLFLSQQQGPQRQMSVDILAWLSFTDSPEQDHISPLVEQVIAHWNVYNAVHYLANVDTAA